MLDIPTRVRVDVETVPAVSDEPNDMGVCDAFEQYAPVREPDAMNAPHPSKVAGIDSTVPAPAHTVSPLSAGSPTAAVPLPSPAPTCTSAPDAALHDRLAGWISDLTTLHELTERLAHTDALPEALDELLRASAALLGARRALVALTPPDGPATTTALGLDRPDLGHLETVPRH
ncbi:MAG TPA: phosphatase, partial [Streptomyces sp.]